jgi:succinate-semialdehyde dehydrogenase/glutarate-semialdehyde dehydrogenase
MALELGGNAPFVVLEDANLRDAADALMINKFRSSGQTCVCTNRVLVHEAVAAKFGQLLAPRIAALRTGPGTDPEMDMGPLIDEEGLDKVRDLVANAVALGASIEAGGTGKDTSGLFYPATLLSGVPVGARCLKEEVFGPVVTLTSFKTDEEAADLANDTEYGLAAYVFSGDSKRGLKFIEQLHFGHVGLNTGTGPVPQVPFGGMKQSGLGREGGVEGIFEFVELQSVPTPLPT